MQEDDKINPALWRDADRIFESLLERPEDEWQTTLESMSLDHALSACVWQLIRNHQMTVGAVDRLPEHVNPEGASQDLSGRVIGRWRLVESNCSRRSSHDFLARGQRLGGLARGGAL